MHIHRHMHRHQYVDSVNMVFVARKGRRGGKGRAVDVIFDVAGYRACIGYSSGAGCFFGGELGI
jgi:hypothetical protein